jgi:KUP system potassium uptake protein
MSIESKTIINKHHKKFMGLVLGALGVVYGDIGTSPLYAINEIFFGQQYSFVGIESILGPISLVVWAITLIISIKYLTLVLRADFDGEGGVFALYGRLHQFKNKYIYYLKILLILAAGLLIGEGIITPAISVLSAVEGLAVYNPSFASKIIPITLFILTSLFLFQKKGSSTLGKIFGSIATLWFLTIGYFGFRAILETPQILAAFNPYWAFTFIQHINVHQSLIVLGSVLLVITGGEALFADMGHFGKKPIRVGWFFFVYPALLLNYLGQGAYLLSGKSLINQNIFFSMIPKTLLFPSIILATCASSIAAQSLISGAFTLTSQAVALGIFPRVKVTHTHFEHEGQIYVGLTNWVLFLGTMILVLTFKNSNSLAAAYGLSLSGVMLSTSFAMMAIAHLIWKWKIYKILLIFVPLAILELLFLMSKSLRFFEGGFIPLGIGLLIFFIMRIWKWGRKETLKGYMSLESLTISEMIDIKNKQTHCIDKNVVLLVPRPLRSIEDKAPPLVQLFYNRYGLFPKNLFLVEAVHRKVPYVHGPRYESFLFYKDSEKGCVASTTIHFGFMEVPNLESVLENLAISHQIELPDNPHKWLIHTSFERLIPKKKMNFLEKIRFQIFIFLRQTTMPAHFYYGLGQKLNLSVDIIPIKLE